ncbi:phage tail tape measure protein (plasmid) [Clostridium botulinum C/D str. BKT12695]|nr:phage tail tape measure protein [Clostridium botulinum C/D str. BKT12695]
MRIISIDLGSIYSSLDLRLDRFNTSIDSAVQGFYRLQLGTEKASNIMDKSVNTAVSNIARSYELWERANERTGRNVFDNSRKIESLRDQIRLLDTEISRSDEILQDIETQFGRNSEEAETYRARVLELRTSQANLTDEMRRAERQTGTFRGRLELLGQEFQRIDERYQAFDKVGDKFKAIGNKLTMGVTMPVVAAGTAATKFAFDFEKGAAKVSTIADTTKVPIEDLKKGVIDLSNETGMSTKELNESLYQAISGSVDTAKAVDFLDVAVKAAKGGFTETSVAVDGLTTVLNSYGLEADKATDISNQMLICQNLGKTTFGELASAVGKVTPIAASLGVTTNELFSSLASTTAQGLATAESVTALKAAMSNIIKPSKEASDAAEQLGIDFSVSAVKSKGWIGFLKDVKQGLEKASPEFAKISEISTKTAERLATLEQQGKKNTDEYKNLKKESKKLSKEFEKLAKMSDSPIGAFAQMFGSVEGLNSILMLTSDQGLKKYNDAMNEMKTNTHALDDAYKKMSETTEAKFNKAMNKAKNSLMELGIKALPVVEKGINLLSDLTDKFSKLSPSTQEWIIKIGLASAALGPFMNVTGGTIKGIGALLKFGPKVKTFFGLFNGARTAATAIETVSSASTIATGATAAMGTATATATGATVASSGALGTLGTSLAGIAGPAAIAVGAIAAVGYGGYKLNKHLKEDAIPAMDLFADRIVKTEKVNKQAVGGVAKSYQKMSVAISKETKQVVGAYMELDKKASNVLMDIRSNSSKFTTDTKNKVLKNFEQITNKSNTLGSKMKNNMVTNFKNLVNTTGVLTEKNKKEIIKQYRDMTNTCSGMSDTQKQKVIADFTTMLNKSTSITKQQKDKLVSIYSQMGEQIKSGMDTKKEEELKILKDLFAESNALTTKEESEILKNTSQNWEEKKKIIDNYQKEIDKITENAIKNNREISEEEYKKINDLKKKMGEDAVKHLSKQEVESKVILERIKGNDERITAEQAGQHIKQLNKLRDDAVKIANDKYNKTLATIIRERDESGKIDADKAEKLKKSAKDIRDKSIQSAEETRKECVEKITSMDSTISKDVDTTTGEIITKSQRMHQTWDNWNPKEHNCVVNFFHNIFTSKKETSSPNKQMTKEEFLKMKEEGYATGTESATPGLHEIAEEGFEIVTDRQYRWFNGGEKVFNHADSKKLLKTLFENKSNPQNIAKEAMAQAKESIVLKPKKVVSENTMKTQLGHLLSWGSTEKKPYEEASNFIGKLNNEQLKHSKYVLDEKYKIRLESVKNDLENVKESNSKKLELEKNRVNSQIAYYQKMQKNTKNKNTKNFYSDKIDTLKQYLKQYESTVKATQDITTKKLEVSKNALEKYYTEAKELLKNREDDLKDFMSTTSNFASKLKEALKQNIDEVQKKEEEAINRKITLNNKWKESTLKSYSDVHEAKIENLQDEYKRFERRVNAETRLLDDKLKKFDSNKADESDAKKERDLRRILSMNYSKRKNIEAQKELNELIESREERHFKESIEQQKESLKEQLDNKKESVEESKKALDKQLHQDKETVDKLYNANKEMYDKQLDYTKKYYEEQKKEANLNAKVQKLIIENNQREIIRLLKSTGKDYEITGATLADRFSSAFIDRIKVVKCVISDITDQLNTIALSNTPSLAMSGAYASPSINNNNTNKVTNTYESLLHADKIVLNGHKDTQSFAEELEFYRQQAAKAKGER